jgi:ketosteroid isomerase-like protein
MRRLYEPDAWLMTQGAPAAKGVEAILAYLKRNKASGTKASFDFTPELITIDGNRGYLISKYWMTLTRANGEKAEAAGRSFLVFKRGGDGAWRLWRDMDNQAPDVRMEDRPGRR